MCQRILPPSPHDEERAGYVLSVMEIARMTREVDLNDANCFVLLASVIGRGYWLKRAKRIATKQTKTP